MDSAKQSICMYIPARMCPLQVRSLTGRLVETREQLAGLRPEQLKVGVHVVHYVGRVVQGQVLTCQLS